jgi:hypothetical protein
MVAASGIAPDSPRLQRGADLSQLHSHGSRTWIEAIASMRYGFAPMVRFARAFAPGRPD